MGGQRQQLRLSRLESGSMGRECSSLGLWASLGLGGAGWSQPRGAGVGVLVLYIPLPCISKVLSGHKDRIASSSILPCGVVLHLPLGLSGFLPCRPQCGCLTLSILTPGHRADFLV